KRIFNLSISIHSTNGKLPLNLFNYTALYRRIDIKSTCKYMEEIMSIALALTVEINCIKIRLLL
ncbi:MAG: hypothetical protein IIW71_04410, partial [Treponema sp.]|nr:hypothetical protein [Treponema sp.]